VGSGGHFFGHDDLAFRSGTFAKGTPLVSSRPIFLTNHRRCGTLMAGRQDTFSPRPGGGHGEAPEPPVHFGWAPLVLPCPRRPVQTIWPRGLPRTWKSANSRRPLPWPIRRRPAMPATRFWPRLPWLKAAPAHERPPCPPLAK